MAKAKRIWLGIGTCALLLGIAISLTWIVRGAYDRMLMLEGTILLVNTTDQAMDVTLDFPSGKQHTFHLPADGNQDFIETDTGEGAIGVSIQNRPTESVGYVTSMNRIIVLSIDDSNTTFSQIFP